MVGLTFCSLSEEYTYCHPSGSFLFCYASEVEHWSQSIPFAPLTPPDTISECASSDSQDMARPPWSRASLSEDWTTVPAEDTSAPVQRSGNGWQQYGAHVTTQENQMLNAHAFMSASHGSVDLGLSPVLSHESQNSHTLNSFSEPDTCVLPPSLDLSFTAEPSWNPSGPVLYTSQVVPYKTNPGSELPCCDYRAQPDGYSVPTSHPVYQGAYPPVFFPQGGQAAYQRPLASYPPTVSMRPILPRTDSPAVHQSTLGSQRALMPQTQGRRNEHLLGPSVSSPPGQPQNGSWGTTTSSTEAGSAIVTSRPMQTSFNVPPDAGLPSVPFPSALVQQQRPNVSLPCVADPTAEDFSAFIHFDHEEHSTQSGALRSDNERTSTNACMQY